VGAARELALEPRLRVGDIHSHIPYEGKVEVKVRTPLRSVLVRMPEWVMAKDPGVTAQINGHPLGFIGRAAT